MFNKKYTKAIKILNDEIDLAHGLLVEYNELAKVIKDDAVRQEHLRKADEWHYRYCTLLELKTQFKKRIGP